MNLPILVPFPIEILSHYILPRASLHRSQQVFPNRYHILYEILLIAQREQVPGDLRSRCDVDATYLSQSIYSYRFL